MVALSRGFIIFLLHPVQAHVDGVAEVALGENHQDSYAGSRFEVRGAGNGSHPLATPTQVNLQLQADTAKGKLKSRGGGKINRIGYRSRLENRGRRENSDTRRRETDTDYGKNIDKETNRGKSKEKNKETNKEKDKEKGKETSKEKSKEKSKGTGRGKVEGKGKGTGRGKGEGKGRGKGRGTGRGKGRGTGEGKGRGTGRGKGEGKGKGKGRGTGRGKGRGTGEGKCKGTGKGGNLKSSVRKAIMNQQNYYRCVQGVGTLKWNKKLADHAAAWATAINGKMEHSPQDTRNNIAGFEVVGQNIAWGEGKIGPDGVKKWYSEIKNTKNGKVTRFAENSGHYTQLVWKATTDVGCASFKKLLCCEYGPMGNFEGEFATNVMGEEGDKAKCKKKWLSEG